MAIVDILASAQGGRFFEAAAMAAEAESGQAKSAISRLAPAIALRLKEKAQRDPASLEALLEILEDDDGTDLATGTALTDSEAISDGKEILIDLYGSTDAALASLKPVAPEANGALLKLAAISATAVLATLAASNASAIVGNGALPASAAGGGGFFSILLAALFKGLLQGAQRQLAPKRRRRRSYSTYATRRTTRRKTTRRRNVGLDDIFRSILGSGR